MVTYSRSKNPTIMIFQILYNNKPSLTSTVMLACSSTACKEVFGNLCWTLIESISYGAYGMWWGCSALGRQVVRSISEMIQWLLSKVRSNEISEIISQISCTDQWLECPLSPDRRIMKIARPQFSRMFNSSIDFMQGSSYRSPLILRDSASNFNF